MPARLKPVQVPPQPATQPPTQAVATSPTEWSGPGGERLLATIDSLGTTSASEVARSIVSSQPNRSNDGAVRHEKTTRESGLFGSKSRSGLKASASGQLSGSSLSRGIKRILSSTKGRGVPAGAASAAAPAAVQAPAAGHQRSSNTGSGGSPTGSNSSSQQVDPQHPLQHASHDKGSARWWTAGCLGPPRLREGDGPIEAMLDTAGSVSRPTDILVSTVTDTTAGVPCRTTSGALGPARSAAAQAASPTPPPGGQGGSQPSSGPGGIAERSGSIGSAGGLVESERLLRLRKSSGKHLRASLERTIQTKGARGGSGPGGAASGTGVDAGGGGNNSTTFSTADSKPRDSFESDWDVMGAEADGNVLSAVGMTTSTMAFDAGPGGSLLPPGSGTLNNGDNEAGTGGHSARSQPRRRQAPSNASRASQELSEGGDGRDTHRSQSRSQSHHQSILQPQGGGSKAAAQRDRERERDREWERQRTGGMQRSPTSSSNVPGDLSFNPNVNNGAGEQRDLRMSAVAPADPGAPTGTDAARNSASEGGAGGTGGGGGGDAPTPSAQSDEDRLAARMMALQNQINALTDEDLLNPASARLSFVSTPPPAAPQPSHSQPHLNQHQQHPHPHQHMHTHQQQPHPQQQLQQQHSHHQHPQYLPQPHPAFQQQQQQHLHAHQHQHPHQQGQAHPLSMMMQYGTSTGMPYMMPDGDLRHLSPTPPGLPGGVAPGGNASSPLGDLHFQGGNGLVQQPSQHAHMGPGPGHPHGLQLRPHRQDPAGMGALDALSAFLGSPPSRGASMYGGGAGLLNTAGTTGTGTSAGGIATSSRPGAGSPGSVAGGGGSVRGGTAGAAGGGGAGAGIRSMQSINEDGFLGPSLQQGGGSSHRLASSHLGGMGGGNSNSSFLSVRPGGGPLPCSDDPAILLTPDDTSMMGASSRGHPAMMRSSDIDTGTPAAAMQDSGKAVTATGMLFSTRGSSLEDRHGLGAAAQAFTAGTRPSSELPSAVSGSPVTRAPAAASAQPQPASAGTGAAAGASGVGASANTAAAAGGAGGGGGGGGRFTLAAALSRFQEELQQSIVPPVLAAGGARAGAPGDAAAGLPASLGSTSSVSGHAPTGRNSFAVDGIPAPPGSSAALGSAAAAAVAAAAALGRGGYGLGNRDGQFPSGLSSDRGVMRELGSSNGVVPGYGARRAPSMHIQNYQVHVQGQGPAQQQPLVPENPEFVVQQLLNSSNTGQLHHFPQQGAPGPSAGQHLGQQLQHLQPPQGHPQGPGFPVGSGGGGAGQGYGGPQGGTVRGARPSGDPPSGSGHQSTDFLYDEFFSNTSPMYDGAPGHGLGAAGSRPQAVIAPSISSGLDGGEPSPSGMPGAGPGFGRVSANVAAAGPAMAGHAGLMPGLGPPPVHNRSVRRNISAESLRIQAAHRSMEGRAAAAAAAAPSGAAPAHPGAQWGGTPPSPLSSASARGGAAQGPLPRLVSGSSYQSDPIGVHTGAPSQASSEVPMSIGEPTLGHPIPEAVASVASASAAIAVSGTATPAGPNPASGVSSSAATHGTVRTHGGQPGNSLSGNVSSGMSSSNGVSPGNVTPQAPALGHGGGTGSNSSRLFATEGSMSIARMDSSAAAMSAATASVGGLADLLGGGSGAFGAVEGRTTTDVVVAGLVESVLRSGAAASLFEEGPPGGSVGGAGVATTMSDDALAAAAQNLAILPHALPPRTGSGGIGPAGGPSSAAVASGGPGVPAHLAAGRGRPASSGSTIQSSAPGVSVQAGMGAAALRSGSVTGAAGVGIGAGGGAGGRSLEMLLAYWEEGGQTRGQSQSLVGGTAAGLAVPPLRSTPQAVAQRRASGPQLPWEGVVVQPVGLGTGPRHGVVELLLMCAGGLVLVFNLVIIVYVLVTMHVLMDQPAGASGGGGAVPRSGEL